MSDPLSILKENLEGNLDRITPVIKGWSKVFQFKVSDGEPFYIEFKNDKAAVVKGEHQSPIATLIVKKEDLVKILRGELDANQAFFKGVLKISGNILETLNLKKVLDTLKK
jgi:putative sterol carrier protein